VQLVGQWLIGAMPRRWAVPNHVGVPRPIPHLYIRREWAFVQPSQVEVAMMPPLSWGPWPVRTPVPRRLRAIAKMMERIDADRQASSYTTCPVAEHDPLVDIAVMLLDG